MEKRETIKTKTLYRNGGAISHWMKRTDTGEKTRQVELSFSSDEPYQRWFGLEVLGHKDGEIDFARAGTGTMPLLADHDHKNQIGVVEKVWIDGNKARAVVRFSKNAAADEVYQDIIDGIRGNVSVGYQIHEMMMTEQKDGIETYRATRWEPHEISIVSVPADFSVGVGRAADDVEHDTIVVRHAEKKTQETIQMSDVNIEQVRQDEVARIREIEALAKRAGLEKEAAEFISSGKPVDEFRVLVIDQLEKKNAAAPVQPIGLSAREQKEYSLFRAVNAVLSGDWSQAGFEAECSAAVAKKTGKEARGFYMPLEIQFRDLTVGSATAGGNLRPTDHLGGQFIEALRNALVLRGLGARVLTGLQGNIAIPAANATTTCYWVAENTAPTEGAPTFRQVTMSPKTGAAYVDMSRRLLQQSDPSVEMIIRDDLLQSMAALLDDSGIEGGATYGPSGITKTTGIGSVAIGSNGGAPTWATVCNLVKEVAIDNALLGSLAFLTNSKVVAKMRQTAKVSSTDSRMILETADLLGYRLVESNIVPSDLTKGSSSGVCSAMIFGNFRDLLIGQWGSGIDIMLDPYSLSTQGAVRMTAFMDVDVAVRHPQSFAACLDLTTT